MLIRLLKGSAITLVMLLAGTIIECVFSESADAQAADGVRASICSDWDHAASDAVTTIAQASNVDLRTVGDAIFRMRRARRSCDIGLIRLACLEYHAIIGGAPGLRDFWLPSSSECSFPDGETASSIGNSLSLR